MLNSTLKLSFRDLFVTGISIVVSEDFLNFPEKIFIKTFVTFAYSFLTYNSKTITNFPHLELI